MRFVMFHFPMKTKCLWRLGASLDCISSHASRIPKSDRSFLLRQLFLPIQRLLEGESLSSGDRKQCTIEIKASPWR